MKLTIILLFCFLSLNLFAQKIEAENYSAMFGVVKEATLDVGAGSELGYIDANDWADYSINPTITGSYTINFRIASMYASQINVLSGTTVLTSVITPVTNGYQTWTTVSSKINLNAGPQTIRILFVKNGLNLNWFELTNPIPSISVIDLKNQIDSLKIKLNSIISKLDSSVITFDSRYVMGKGTTTSPYYFIIPQIGTTTTAPIIK